MQLECACTTDLWEQGLAFLKHVSTRSGYAQLDHWHLRFSVRIPANLHEEKEVIKNSEIRFASNTGRDTEL